MRKLIKEQLEKDFNILNQQLVKEDDYSQLIRVIDTIKKFITNELYQSEMKSIFNKAPDLYTTPVRNAVLDIINILGGKHQLIDQCFEKTDHAEDPLGYCCELTYEIITNVNFLNVAENGDIITNDV